MPADIKDVTEFLQTARDRFDFGRLADATDREAAEYDNKFANADNKNLDQWDKAAKASRKKRPIIQWNRIPVSVQSVVNEGRQNKPSILIAPDDQGTQETAEYLKGRIRHIEYEANADTAKDTARDQQVTSGRGFLRVGTEYIPGTFDQRITLDRIENQFSVVYDPGAVLYDRSDADWVFIISQISRDAHKRKYGEDSVINRLDFADAIRMAPEWIGIGANNEMIQIAEYFQKEFRDRTLCLLGSTGLPAWKDDIAGQYEALKAKGLILAERIEQCPVIWQYVINGAEVLGKPKQWIGSTIPIVPFWGREATVDGVRRTFSLVRNAIFPQQLLNIYVSNLAELIGQMPKTPYMVPIGGIPASMEEVYERLNVEARAFVLYNPFNDAGQPLPPPSRVTAEPPIQACVIGINQCIDAIKAAMGVFDASLGARSNENSGLAIKRRNIQATMTNYHFADNEARSNKYLGEILVELLPKIDKQGSVNPVRSQDGKTTQVPVGIPYSDPKTGEEITHDLLAGQYGVTVSQGKSWQSAREEQVDRDTTLIEAQPELIYAIGPQMFRADDTAGSEERAEALERYINLKFPGLIPPKDAAQGKIDPQQVQQAMAAKDGEIQKLHAFAQSLHETIATKQPELQAKLQQAQMEDATRRWTVEEQEKNALAVKQMDLDFQREKLQVEAAAQTLKVASAEGVEELRQQIQILMHERGLAATAAAQQSMQEHTADQAGQARSAAADSQESAQEHTADQAEQARDAAADSQANAQDHQSEFAQQAQSQPTEEGK